MTENISVANKPSATKTILLAWAIAGTADLLSALFVYTVVLHKTTVAGILESIASGVFGKSANGGGLSMQLYGVLLHYFIALCFTVFYFLIYPYIKSIGRYRILAGILYGAFVWCVMNLVVFKIVFGRTSTLTPDSIAIGAGILMVCIGMPLSFIISKYYEQYKNYETTV